jgi:hypothetical protein
LRELKYYVACTVDGFIGRADGSFTLTQSRSYRSGVIIAHYRTGGEVS